MRRARTFLIVVAVAVLLARLGPFGTFFDLPPAQRFAYWIGLTLLLWLQIEVALHFLRGLSATARLGWIGRSVVAALIASVPSAFEVAWAESLLRVQRDLGLLDIARIYGDVAAIAVGLTLLVELARRDRRSPSRQPERHAEGKEASLDATMAVAPGSSGPDRLLAALPLERRGAIHAFAAEDHYLRVYTDRGEALILLRFGDALAEVAALDGLRVHRSWWVAREAVQAAERDGDRVALLLPNGLRVPVSRTYLLAVREAGLAPA
jgi:hypothetical protein